MKIKMLEYFQGRDVSALRLPQRTTVTVMEPGAEYEVDDELGAFLLKAHKAELVKDAPHYGGQVEPELQPRQDDLKAEEMKSHEGKTAGDFEPLPEIDPEAPLTERVAKPKAKRGRK